MSSACSLSGAREGSRQMSVAFALMASSWPDSTVPPPVEESFTSGSPSTR